MNALIPNIHHVLTASFCRAFEELGISVLVPAVDEARQSALSKYRSPLAGAFDFQPFLAAERVRNCRIVDLEALADLDIDMIVIGGHGVQRAVLKFLLPMLKQRRDVHLIYFCGNEIPNYRWDLVNNLLCADEISWSRHGSQIANAARYYPWIDYDRFAWIEPNDSRRLVSCIINYASRYPADFEIARAIVDSVPGATHELIDKVSHARVAEIIQRCAASLHVKPEEGYGYAVIESLACGRPIVAPRRHVQGRAMARWCIEGETAMLFDSVDDARQSLTRFFDDADLRHALQRSSASRIRSIIDNDEQTETLGKFIQQLRPQPAKNLKSHLLDFRWRHR